MRAQIAFPDEEVITEETTGEEIYFIYRGIAGERASLDEDENTRDESTPAKWLQT
jgi:hypothetical protein